MREKWIEEEKERRLKERKARSIEPKPDFGHQKADAIPLSEYQPVPRDRVLQEDPRSLEDYLDTIKEEDWEVFDREA